MTSPMSPSTPAAASTVRCSPCRKTYTLESLANPRRCPQCGGPTRTPAQDEGYKAATEASLEDLRSQSLFMMRLLSYGMAGVVLITHMIPDRQLAAFEEPGLYMMPFLPHELEGHYGAFLERVMMVTSTVSLLTTELWAWTRKNFWMVIASCFIQLAAILIFFVLMGLLALVLNGRLAFIIAVTPLAGSLVAWHHFRGYTKILRLQQGKFR